MGRLNLALSNLRSAPVLVHCHASTLDALIIYGHEA
jgi:hypothetical protein